MSEKLTKDAIDLSTLSIPRLFGRYFLPTLLGMLSISAMTPSASPCLKSLRLL